MRLSQTKFAEVLGLTTRQIHNLRAQGMPSEAEGRFRFFGGEAVRWYVAFKIEEERKKHERTAKDDLEVEKLSHQIREARVRADLAEEKSVLVEDALAEWDEAAGLVRAEIVKIPTRFGGDVNPKDPAAGEDALELVADELLGSIQEILAPPEELSGAA